MTALEQFEETFWERHSNPKSGWSRTLLLPAILYAIYSRNWRFGAAAVAFTILNPLLFSPPKTDDAWMTRVVLAERWWTRERQEGVLELSYPNALNVLNVPTSGYAVVAAYRKQPIRAAVAGVAAMALKFWYVAELVRRYDARQSE
ncbi:DUF6653 family protein [Haloterrigena salifodinae]|uniref:DUF6653 family protein n=1 Tax=Haloterrigena salifodinae TaxID=2675099 RepID=UPI000F85C4A0|nr:DUF6653 family protein [Haloterrigena salifodinae]